MIDVKNWYSTIATSVAVLLWITVTTPAADSTNFQRIAGVDQAIQTAVEYTGFDQSPTYHGRAFAARAERVMGVGLSNAFKYDISDTTPIWRVSVDSVVLDIGIIDSATESEYAKTFEVFIDAETGIFLKAVARSGLFADSMLGDPWAELPESLHVMKGNIVATPTNERPLVTMYEALNDGCMMSLLSASEIVVYYVECRTIRDMAVTWVNQSPDPAWLIIAKRLEQPPDYLGGKGAAKEPIVESCFINARTGVPSGTLTIQRSKNLRRRGP